MRCLVLLSWKLLQHEGLLQRRDTVLVLGRSHTVFSDTAPGALPVPPNGGSLTHYQFQTSISYRSTKEWRLRQRIEEKGGRSQGSFRALCFALGNGPNGSAADYRLWPKTNGVCNGGRRSCQPHLLCALNPEVGGARRLVVVFWSLSTDGIGWRHRKFPSTTVIRVQDHTWALGYVSVVVNSGGA